MSKLFITIFSLLISCAISAQVGINTEKPTADLDINGKLISRTGILRIGENQSPGIAGQILQSQGPNKAPDWRTPVSTKRGSGYYLYGSFSATDDIGTVIAKEQESGFEFYEENEATDGWILIPGLTKTISLNPLDPSKPNELRENYLVLYLESVIQANNYKQFHMNGYVSFGIGIFVDGELKGTSIDEIPFLGEMTFIAIKVNTVAIVKDITNGDHTIQVGVKRRYSAIPPPEVSNGYEVKISFGVKNPDPQATNTNNFMNQSVFSGDLYLKNTK